MLVEIRSKTDKLLFTTYVYPLRIALEVAIQNGANLFKANLSRANLSRVDLFKANLFGANLSRANLSGVDLFKANLSEANLFKANLFGAIGIERKKDAK